MEQAKLVIELKIMDPPASMTYAIELRLLAARLHDSCKCIAPDGRTSHSSVAGLQNGTEASQAQFFTDTMLAVRHLSTAGLKSNVGHVL